MQIRILEGKAATLS